MKVILWLVIIYVVVKYVVRPLLMAIIVKSAGKMMQDFQKQAGQTKSQQEPLKNKEKAKEVVGEYIDYEEIK
jgi:hypothetical protein